VTESAIQIGIAVSFLLVAFLTSAWVNAISRLTMARALRLEHEHPKKGKLLVEIAGNPRPFLTASLLVMLIARVTAMVLVTSLMVRQDVVLAEVLAVVILTFVVFHVVELAPRTWILERPDQVMLLSARPVFYLGKALLPLSAVLVRLNRVFLLILPGRGVPRGPITSEEEIKSIIDVAQSEDVIEADEREMIHSIFEFGDTVVREVMVPRPDMVCLDGDMPIKEALEKMLRSPYSRMPVIEGEMDNVVGTIYLKDVVKKTLNGSKKLKTAQDLSREAHFVPESKKVMELLREMREKKTHIMIVVDEYGQVAGLVTLEDLLEELVGDISDEYDREDPIVEEIDLETLRVDARLGIEELNELLSAELPHEEWDSVGGLIAAVLGRVANEGDEVSVDGIRFEVEETKGRRIAKVLVHHSAAAT
jgi:CBS domain containing-hemolysin-like protein